MGGSNDSPPQGQEMSDEDFATLNFISSEIANLTAAARECKVQIASEYHGPSASAPPEQEDHSGSLLEGRKLV